MTYLWWWRRLLRVPGTTRRSNQSILKEISSEYSLEGLMLKLKLQYFGQLMQRTDSFKNTLMLGEIEGRRRGWQRMRWHYWLDGHEFEQPLGVGDGQGSLACYSLWGGRVGHKWVTKLNWYLYIYVYIPTHETWINVHFLTFCTVFIFRNVISYFSNQERANLFSFWNKLLGFL